MLPAVSVSAEVSVVATGQGLVLLDVGTGTFAPHPETEAEGRTLSLQANDQRIVQLRSDTTGTQVIEVGPRRLTTLFEDPTSWEGLALTEDSIELGRLRETEVETLTLSFEGEELERVRTLAPPGAIAISPRAAGSGSYVVALTGGGATSELARIVDGSWQPIAEVTGAISGPIVDTEGRVVFSAAGQLSKLDGGQAFPLEEDRLVTCLETHAGIAYACSSTGLFSLEASGLGNRVFDLSELQPPDSELVPDQVSDDCELQWQRYRIDLLALGIEPPDAEYDAGARINDAGGDREDAPDAERPASTSSSTCGVRRSSRTEENFLALALLAAASLFVVVRRAPRTRRARSSRTPGNEQHRAAEYAAIGRGVVGVVSSVGIDSGALNTQVEP